MLFRLKRAGRWNLANIHSRRSFHPVEVNERTLAAGTTPRAKRKISDIFHAMAFYDRQSLALHPTVVRGSFQCGHQLAELIHMFPLSSEKKLAPCFPCYRSHQFELAALIIPR